MPWANISCDDKDQSVNCQYIAKTSNYIYFQIAAKLYCPVHYFLDTVLYVTQSESGKKQFIQLIVTLM